jgi:ABC-type nickel/cobalt efflux system permease component RcnA
VLSFLALGFLIGLRHALEPDHVAAVVSLSTRGGSLRDQARGGALWGLGHALTLLLLAGGCVAFGLVVPERAGRLLEGAVGLMLVGLGVSVFARLRRGGVHVHGHVHGDGTAHLHAHAHPPQVDHTGDPHEHVHPRPSWRGLGVGAVHGLAGSSALVLLVGSAAQAPLLGLLYVALFGLGASAGMMLLAATLSLPFGTSARRRSGLYRLLCAGAGTASVVLGVQLVWALASGGAA